MLLLADFFLTESKNMGKEACCKIMPAFHTLTGCDYTASVFGPSKYNIFKNMQKHSNAKRLLSSLNTKRVEVPDAIDFIIPIVYNPLKPEKTTEQSRYVTAIKTSKMRNKKFNSTR